MNQRDAEIISAADGDLIQLEIAGKKLKVKLNIENGLPQGITGLSVNLAGIPFIDLPCRGKYYKI